MKTTSKAGTQKKGLRRPVSASGLGISSILVPIDFSEASEMALGYALKMAQACGADLALVHVMEPATTPNFAKDFPLAQENEAKKEECRRELELLAERAGVPPNMLERVVVRYGRAFNEIVSAARTLKSDLIVVATHGRTGLKHVLMGSTSERVVQHAPCPVLVVRSAKRDLIRS